MLLKPGRFGFSHEETGRIVGADVKTPLPFFYTVGWVNRIIRALLNTLNPTVEKSWILLNMRNRSFRLLWNATDNQTSVSHTWLNRPHAGWRGTNPYQSRLAKDHVIKVLLQHIQQ